ncbi:peptidoglycan-binding domain-containing protein [Parasulfitobacter algicola]|uniref:Peptidoglycan-binding protein n=1 Tax=Parasulfitobacter algicola TaxID=2614809 RepID=A0ABX2ILC7_9RHOB|nr:peptidoglycan-binding domain-containing protein [Sulfitobacter algicola]NSX53671.1 peptidoglycan-binding protein [Sulfitobacter algicola]
MILQRQTYAWSRPDILARGLLLAIGLILSAQQASAQNDRVVALVVSVGDGEARADDVQSQLQSMGVETLRSINPNNAELRSMVRRFADESEDASATFVYLDMPAVSFEGREYVMPNGAGLLSYTDGTGRPTDLFTQAIPLLAFARTAAQAEQGGAVVTTVSEPPGGLPTGMAQIVTAPDPVAGASSIVVVSDNTADLVLQVIAAAGQDDTVEIGAMFRRMTVHDGVSVSELPNAPIFLKRAPEPVSVPDPVTVVPDETEPSEVVENPVATVPPQVVEAPETLEELEILERSMSRSAKRSIQRRLRDLGHYKGLVDGIFGPQTREAITIFQTTRSEEQTGLLTRRQLLDLRVQG